MISLPLNRIELFYAKMKDSSRLLRKVCKISKKYFKFSEQNLLSICAGKTTVVRPCDFTPLRSADLSFIHCVCSNVTKVIEWKWQMLYPENTISVHVLCLQVMNYFLFALWSIIIAVVWEERYALMLVLGVIKLLLCFAFVIYWNDKDIHSP